MGYTQQQATLSDLILFLSKVTEDDLRNITTEEIINGFFRERESLAMQEIHRTNQLHEEFQFNYI